jgi:hypothetical protein
LLSCGATAAKLVDILAINHAVELLST